MGQNASSEPQNHRCRFEHAPSLFFRVQLIWAKQNSPLFQRVSLNVVREVSSYFSFPSHLLCASRKSVFYYTPSTHCWTAYFSLPSSFTLLNFVFIGFNRVFLTLKDDKSQSGELPNVAVFEEEEVRVVGQAKYYHGVAYDEQQNLVYLFGGITMQDRTDCVKSKECRKFDVRSRQIALISDMLEERSHFGCCWHYGRVYLCGGYQCSVEAFETRSERFEIVERVRFDVGVETNFIAVSLGEELVIVSNVAIWRKGKNAWQRKPRKDSRSSFVWVRGSQIIESILYFTEYLKCVALDLSTGEEAIYPLTN